MTPRVQATTNTKKDNLVYIKIKNICGSKDTIKKEQFTEWGKMFTIIYLKYIKNSYNSIMGKKITQTLFQRRYKFPISTQTDAQYY